MIKFSTKAYKNIVNHAEDGKPFEICGMLGGEKKTEKEDDKNTKVNNIYKIKNVSETPKTNYLMEPEEQLEKIEELEKKEELIGFYHSHPKGPYGPSKTDEKRANWPDHYYIIVSFSTNNKGKPLETEEEINIKDNACIGAWRWTGKEFKEEKIKIVP